MRILFFFLLLSAFVSAQDRMIDADSVIKTTHQGTYNGKSISYTAHCGTQPVWNDDGKAVATLHYTYYEKNNESDQSRRPLIISFNGGPGSASVWMHLA